MEPPKFASGSAAKPIDLERPNQEEYLHFLRQSKSSETTRAHNAPPVVSDPKMARIWELVDQVADANVPILVSGESGTGKEVVARDIHSKSARKQAPFVAINCAALPPELLESELFGFEKGAFTGAHQRHLGKFEQAQGGTLLLDEVTEMAKPLQAKLLRALQEKEIERIGGSGPIAVDVRIIATSNRNILKSVSDGSFRQDLYYRLHVINIEIPPLRQRPKDIEALAKHFLSRFAMEFGKVGLQFSEQAAQRLRSHSWPGNVRELENTIQRAVLTSEGPTITPDKITVCESSTEESMLWVQSLPIGRPLKEVETQFILETLKHHDGNRTHASRTLGISLRTLRNKINEFTAMGLQVTAPGASKEAS